MQQVLVIHGAGGFVALDRSDFVAALRGKKASLDDLRRSGDWKSNLQKDLGPEFDVLQPRMPDADQPHYEAWKAWFEHIAPPLDEEVVLIGHSLGGLFLVKYLAENKFSKKVKALFLVATPYTGPEVVLESKWIRESGWELGDLENLQAQCNKIFVYHSADDPAVPYTAAETYAAKLPQATLRRLEGRGHIRDEHLPELVADIKAI